MNERRQSNSEYINWEALLQNQEFLSGVMPPLKFYVVGENYSEFNKATINLSITDEELKALPDYESAKKLREGLRPLNTPDEVRNFCSENGFKFVNPEQYERIIKNQLRVYSEKISDQMEKDQQFPKPN